MPITAFYAALLVPLFIVLSVRVIGLRQSAKVLIGDGGVAQLARRVRVHGNFAEYAPFALILLGLAESLRSPSWLLHICGIVLVAARLVHAFGVSQAKENIGFRVAGMVGTFSVLAVLGLTCLVGAWSSL